MNIKDTLDTRHGSHGSFKENGRVTMALIAQLKSGPSWHSMSTDQQLAAIFIAHKLARITCGNSNFPDHWHDIAGYATLVEESL